MMKWRIFVLGDSRTGTTSLHHYFWSNGIPSEHGFASAIAPSGEVTVESVFQSVREITNHPRVYWPRVKEYIYRSEAVAFGDYPVRIFWRELLEEFPCCHFILSVRDCTELWRDSMNRTFGSVLSQQDLDLFEKYYVVVNQLIRDYYRDCGTSFCEIVAEDSSLIKTRKLEKLLGRHETIPVGHHNTINSKIEI